MSDLPSFPTPGQVSYASSHQSQPRKTSQPSYRPPAGNRMPSNQSVHSQQQHYHQAPPPQQFRPQQNYAPPPNDYYRKQQQQFPPQQVYQQPAPQHAQPAPQPQYQQGYSQQPKVNYHQSQPHSPSYEYQQQQLYQQQAQQQQQYQNGNDFRNTPPKKVAPPPARPHNKSKESLAESTTTTSSSSKNKKLEMELRSVFEKVDTNHSGRISYSELSFALLNFDRTKFQDSTLRLMINLFGAGPGEYQNSHLTFDQFTSLWKYLSAYKKLFIQADTDQSGDISFGEFQKVLEQIGYKLDIDLVLHLFSRYCSTSSGRSSGSSGSSEGRGVGRLKFDSFIELLVYLRKLTDVFKKYDKDLSGTATINFSDFLFEVSNLT
ncbi:Peflin [Spathaspora sp. JA1]|nr:Peflin [Spathaspora sp. JA1]